MRKLFAENLGSHLRTKMRMLVKLITIGSLNNGLLNSFISTLYEMLDGNYVMNWKSALIQINKWQLGKQAT